jgi:uncharacterized protein (DUF924 family)
MGTTRPKKIHKMAPPPPLSEAERVWAFWFGGAVADNFRAKWFPVASLQAQADADALIEAQFGDLLEAALRGACSMQGRLSASVRASWQPWVLCLVMRRQLRTCGSVAAPVGGCMRSPKPRTLAPRCAGELDGWRATPHTCVCLIVVLDQFSRHVNRRRREPPGSAPQAAADAAALSAAEALLAAGWEARLSVPEHIFALMPLRHTAQLPQLERAMAQARGKRPLLRARACVLFALSSPADCACAVRALCGAG